MNWVEKIKRYYTIGIYNNADVWDFVAYSKITKIEYKSITKTEYPTTRPNIEN